MILEELILIPPLNRDYFLLLSEGTNLRFVLQSLIPFQNPAIAIDLDALGPEEREICRQQD